MPVAPLLIVLAVLAGFAALMWLVSSWFDAHYVPAPEEQRATDPD